MSTPSEAPVLITTLPTGCTVLGKREYTVDGSEGEFESGATRHAIVVVVRSVKRSLQKSPER